MGGCISGHLLSNLVAPILQLSFAAADRTVRSVHSFASNWRPHFWTFAVQPGHANLSSNLRGAAAADIFQA